MRLPPRPAFLLDLDGTLLDIAPTPDQVVVPEGLIASLRGLRRRYGDAVAIVTGRRIDEIDALLGDAAYAVAGEHGAAIRAAPGAGPRLAELPAVPPAWTATARALAGENVGVIFEPKAHGFVLHFRAAPAAGAALCAALRTLIADAPGFRLMAAKMAWELRPAATDKGVAVRALMAAPPFVGRAPVFVGDDVTDEDGIAAAVALGGVGLRVAEAFGDPQGVRNWINALAGGADTDR